MRETLALPTTSKTQQKLEGELIILSILNPLQWNKLGQIHDPPTLLRPSTPKKRNMAHHWAEEIHFNLYSYLLSNISVLFENNLGINHHLYCIGACLPSRKGQWVSFEQDWLIDKEIHLNLVFEVTWTLTMNPDHSYWLLSFLQLFNSVFFHMTLYLEVKVLSNNRTLTSKFLKS